ncbi:Superoxide dismutase [Zea mays]|uniref:superoxide dismutase n=1 Tax=Zea mays TaxID=4577 RepID=A0A1D6FNG4_MAIZE|nr:Superoxide dismutase [Zea mays]
MNAEGAALQGSGWVWLALDKEAKKLSVETTANQGSNALWGYSKIQTRSGALCFLPSSYLPNPN